MTAHPLAGRVALVTGGSRGIGLEITRGLVEAGAEVAVVYRADAAAAQAVVEELHPACSAWQADVTDLESVERLVEGVTARHGSIDMLVSNAGAWRGGRIESVDPADWRLVVETSLLGAYHLCRSIVPLMRAKAYGRIVLVSSAVGLMGFEGDTAYASAKAGLFGLTRALSKEVGRDGITVNAVAPGYVPTDMTSNVSERARQLMVERTSLRRAGTALEVAQAVRFLVSEAGYATGSVLVLDGGMSL